MDEFSKKRFERQLQQKLAPEEVTANLMQASLFLVAYELLKGEIVEKTKSFFVDGFLEGANTYSPQYQTDVLSLHPNRFRASCLWLSKMGVLNDADVDMACAIREHRHKVAHELPNILIDPDTTINTHLITEAHRLISLIGRFWGRVSIDTNSDFDGQDVADEDILSGSMFLMNHVLSIFLKGST